MHCNQQVTLVVCQFNNNVYNYSNATSLLNSSAEEKDYILYFCNAVAQNEWLSKLLIMDDD